MQTTQRFSEEALLLMRDLEAKVEQGIYTKEASHSALKPVRDDGGKLYQCYEQNDNYKDKDGKLRYTVVHFKEKDGDYHSGYVNIYGEPGLNTV